VLLLAAVFFFKYAFDKGWISETVRVLMGAAVGFVMIGLGEWALIKRKLQLFAAGIMGGGVVLLYFVVFVASPNGWYHLIGAPLAFGLMCVVTALGMALSVQTRMLSTALVALIGAMATPVLLSTGENRQVLLMCYMLVVDAGFLSLGLGMRWPVLAPLSLAGAAGLFGGWYAQHFAPGAWPRTIGFAWAFLGEFLAYLAVGIRTRRLGLQGAKVMLLAVVGAFTVLLLGEFIVYACVAMHLDRLDEPTAQGILVVVGSAAVVLWSCLVHSVSMTALYVNVLPLMLITLGYALLGQGLVLLVLAVPIQFDKANIPLAWSIQGVVVMFLAHRLGSLPLLIMAPTVLAGGCPDPGGRGLLGRPGRARTARQRRHVGVAGPVGRAGRPRFPSRPRRRGRQARLLALSAGRARLCL